MAGRLIYGGSFNPLHIGHMRLAIESAEILADLVDGVDLLPVAHPPHKDIRDLLPFELRAKMIRQTLKSLPGMRCNDSEAKRSGPSYSYDTLTSMRQRPNPDELYFLLGSQDYALLPTWHKGLELVDICNLAIAPRGDFSLHDFIEQTRKFWPLGKPDSASEKNLRYTGQDAACLRMPSGNVVFYLPVPYLDISASSIRKSWIEGRNVEYLVPVPVLEILEKERQEITACWREKY